MVVEIQSDSSANDLKFKLKTMLEFAQRVETIKERAYGFSSHSM